MAKRKPISIINSLGRVNSLPSIVDNRLVSTDSILSAADKLRDKYSNDAYNNYNASLFPEIKTNIEPIQFEQPTIEVQEKPLSYNKSKKTSSSYKGSKNDFINNIYNSYYKAVRPGAASDADADRQARFLTQKAAFETGWGKHIANTHNYGGHKGKNSWLSFNSMDDFTRKDVALLDKKWGNWRNAKNEGQFIDAINTNNGYGMYAPPTENTNYKGRYSSLTSGINNTINMGRRKLRCGGKSDRPKAWIGAVVSAAGSILGSILSSDAQEKQAEEQRRKEEHQAALKRAEGLTESLGLMQAAQKEYENRFRVNYANGGRRRLRQGVEITDGGYAIPIGQNTFLLRGGSHEDINETGQTGIGLNIGGKEIEAEGGEVIQKTPTEVRVFSKQPILNGVAPADAVKAGANKNEIFAIQQSLNGDYNGNNTRKAIRRLSRRNYLSEYNMIDHMRNGGYITRPVGRNKFVTGGTLQYVNGMWQKRVNYPNSSNGYWQIIDNDEATRLRNSGWTVNSSPSINRNTIRRIVSQNNTTPKNSSTKNNTTRSNINTFVNSSTNYSFGKARGNKAAPYDAIQIGASVPTLNKTNVSIPSIDDYYNNNRRSIATRGSVSASKTPLSFKVGYTPDYTSQQEADYIKSQINKNANTVGIGNPTTVTDGNYFGLDYTDQQMLDHINGNINSSNGEVHYTNPNEGILREAASGQRTDMNTGTYVQNNNNNEVGKTNKWGTVFKGSDWIGLGADLIGSLGSALINYNAAKNIGDPAAPVRVSPGKLITNWNIAPRLSEVNMMRGRMLRDSDEAVNSAARLNKRNAINMFTNNQADKLWGEKTNREVELLNQDALNQQQINAQNVTAYNDYLNRLYDARTRRGLMRSQALQVGLSGLSDAVGNFLDQGKQRYSDQQAMRYYTALLPENGRQWLRRNGVDFLRRGGRIK